MDRPNGEWREPPGNHGDWERINRGALVVGLALLGILIGIFVAVALALDMFPRCS
jgi:uncharacterized membrane protein YjfL (UPF0719 family)